MFLPVTPKWCLSAFMPHFLSDASLPHYFNYICLHATYSDTRYTVLLDCTPHSAVPAAWRSLHCPPAEHHKVALPTFVHFVISLPACMPHSTVPVCMPHSVISGCMPHCVVRQHSCACHSSLVLPVKPPGLYLRYLR